MHQDQALIAILIDIRWIKNRARCDDFRNPSFRHHNALPAAAPEAHAHWKLNPPSWPVTSTTSPTKNNPEIFRLSIVLAESSSVSTPPAVTSAFSYPSVPAGSISHA